MLIVWIVERILNYNIILYYNIYAALRVYVYFITSSPHSRFTTNKIMTLYIIIIIIIIVKISIEYYYGLKIGTYYIDIIICNITTIFITILYYNKFIYYACSLSKFGLISL